MAERDETLAFKWTGLGVGLLVVLCSGEVVLAGLALVHVWAHAAVGRLVGAPVAVWYGWGPVIADRTGARGGWGLASFPGVFAQPGDAFRAASLWRRWAVWASGPVVGAAVGLGLAWAAFTGAALEPRGEVSEWWVPASGLQVGRVWEDSAAEAAGLRAGDVIRSVDGAVLETMGGLAAAVSEGRPVELGLEREGAVLSVAVQPRQVFDPSRGLARWQLGVQPVEGTLVAGEVRWRQRSLGEAASAGGDRLVQVGVGVLALFQAEAGTLGGPVAVAGAGSGPRPPGVWGTLRLGTVLSLVGLMTVRQLGIFVLWNLLPLPGSDGLALVDEGMRSVVGRPVPRWVGWVGLLAVAGLFAVTGGLVVAADVGRLLAGD